MVRTFSAIHSGIGATVVEIEASVQKALPAIVVTGLPGDVVKESRERIRACLSGMGFDVPSARVVIHLSPATARKQGSQLDLGVAVSLLVAECAIVPRQNITQLGFLGELCMDGRIRGVCGALSLAEALMNGKLDTVLVPAENASEIGLLGSPRVRVVSHLSDVLQFLESAAVLRDPPQTEFCPQRLEPSGELDAIHGQTAAKRAVQISIAGRHHLLMIGPPGVGKSLLARAAASLLPPLTKEELIALVKMRGTFDEKDLSSGERPFRSPHHSISAAGLLGGGSGTVLAGEVTLAHGGILFLDELPEFRKDALEGLREPLQSAEIHLNRVGAHLTLPARFTLIAAMNPCPCGYLWDSRRRCGCDPAKASAYRRKVSGPIYDRLDLSILLGAATSSSPSPGPSQEMLRTTVGKARALQAARFDSSVITNADAPIDFEQGPFLLGVEEREWLDERCRADSLSFRSMHKVVRVARTIADLEQEGAIRSSHLREAWELRCHDYSEPR